jgi:hypothetical protein
MPRQISHSVDHAHHLDAVIKRLIEDKPTLVLEIKPARGRFRMPVTHMFSLRLLVDAIANLEKDPFPTAGFRSTKAM